MRRAREWLPEDGSSFSIGVAVPERHLVAKVEEELTKHGVVATSIGQDGPRKPDAVHVGTLHRFKGLEYQMMLIAGASAGSIPSARVESARAEDPERYERQLKQVRSLLFVAATRARDTLVITWHGMPSPFLPRVLAVVAVGASACLLNSNDVSPAERSPAEVDRKPHAFS